MRGWFNLFCLCLLLATVVGCRGCTPQPPAKETAEETEARKKKRRIVTKELRALPYAQDVPGNFLKPGHWYEGSQKLKANFGDESLSATITLLNKEKKPAPFALNQAPIDFHRNLSVALGQEKNIQFKFFQPEVGATDVNNLDVDIVAATTNILYSQRGLGTPVVEEAFPSKLLDGYQYSLVTLSRDPSRFTFWRGLDCIIWPSKARMAEERVAPHRVVDLKEDEFATQFPSKLYAMTSISHVVVNDTSLSMMSADQQQGIQDWLHFGGTLILNGPEALGGIETSFLKELSPLVRTTSEEFSGGDVALLNEGWSIKQVLGDRVEFAPDHTITKLAGELGEGAQWIPFKQANDTSEASGALTGLVAERLVGQGRIVMTTFPMSDNAFLKWPSYSSLIHNAILRKPRRDVSTGNEADTKYAGEFESTEQNPLHSTRMRLWARDLDATTMRSKKESKIAMGTKHLSSFKSSKRSSLGAWNPDSLVAEKSREALQESSGITVPRVQTIVKLLLGYLAVLVPLNWIVFRLMGRVELAWATAPFIAIIGAFVVARSVQLDVGFSRSQTSFGFIECHQGYSRGVLSNFTALYSSLSTNYRTIFEKDTGLVLPLASGSGKVRRTRGSVAKIDYWCADESGEGMQSSPVFSNTTGLFQSEELLDLGGQLKATLDPKGKLRVESSVDFPVQDLAILGLNHRGELQTGWIGDLPSGATKDCGLETSEEDDRWRKEWNAKPSLAKPNYIRADDVRWTEAELEGELYLGGMLDEIAASYPLEVGEYIGIGWTDKPMGTLVITPVAKQKKEKTIVLLHVSCGKLRPAQADVRIFQKIVSESPE